MVLIADVHPWQQEEGCTWPDTHSRIHQLTLGYTYTHHQSIYSYNYRSKLTGGHHLGGKVTHAIYEGHLHVHVYI